MIKGSVKAPTADQLRGIPGYPSVGRLQKGAVAVIECEQEIPCNPCEVSCSKNAITVGRPITNLPILNEDLCNGCGTCIAQCPGQAIFVLNMAYSAEKALVQIPYEYLPVPQEGDIVNVGNRDGKVIGQGKIVKVVNIKKNNRTIVVSIEVDKKIGEEVRSIVN